MTDPAEGLLKEAARSADQGNNEEALEAIAAALAQAEDLQLRFDALLLRARTEGFGVGDRARALQTYWEARHLTRANHLGRAGEADLGIGMVLLELDRRNEGLEAIRRAVRYFRKAGNTYLRGCAETLLADVALQEEDDDLADRHLEVATDLLLATGEPRMLSSTLTLRAQIFARQGRDAEAEALLTRAAELAASIGHARIESELQDRRRAVRSTIASSAFSGGDREKGPAGR